MSRSVQTQKYYMRGWVYSVERNWIIVKVGSLLLKMKRSIVAEKMASHGQASVAARNFAGRIIRGKKICREDEQAAKPQIWRRFWVSQLIKTLLRYSFGNGYCSRALVVLQIFIVGANMADQEDFIQQWFITAIEIVIFVQGRQ